MTYIVHYICRQRQLLKNIINLIMERTIENN